MLVDPSISPPACSSGGHTERSRSADEAMPSHLYGQGSPNSHLEAMAMTRLKAKRRVTQLHIRAISNQVPTPPSPCHSQLCTPRVSATLQAILRAGLRASLSRPQPLRGARGHWWIVPPTTTTPFPGVFQPESHQWPTTRSHSLIAALQHYTTPLEDGRDGGYQRNRRH